MTSQLLKKVNFAIRLLLGAEKMANKVGQPVEIGYSGGKDSDVILELARMSGIKYRAIYKNTTIDPPGTIGYVKSKGVEIIRPKETFAQIMARKGWPSRTARFCCSELKEYKVLDYSVVGIRRDESKKRAERYKEPEVCRVYNSNDKTRQYLPILDWTAADVEAFIKERNIECHPLYYDKDGSFHSERRLGCLGCPLKSRRKRISDFKSYPNLVKMYCRQGEAYRKSHPESPNIKMFATVYDWFVFSLFCDSHEDFIYKYGLNFFNDKVDCKKLLEDYFNIDLKLLQ